MNIKELQAFIMLAHSLNYRAAAEKIFITQSALTKKINQLESSLGLPLFVRTNKQTRLSQEGEQLLPYAENIMRQVNQFEEKVGRLHQDRQRDDVLKVGFGLASSSVIAEITRLCNQLNPDIKLQYLDSPSAEQRELLIDKKIHVGLMRVLEDERIAYLPFRHDELVMITAASTAQRDGKNAIDIINRTLRSGSLFVVNPDICQVNSELIDKFFPGAKMLQSAIDFVSNYQTMINLVRAGSGTGLLPRSALTNDVGSLTVIPVPNARWDIAIAWNKFDSNLQRDRLIDMIKAHKNDFRSAC